MVYKADIVKEYGISFAEAEQLLEAIDREALLQKNRERYTHSLWDKASPVNGVAAETIKSRRDFPAHPDAAAYFIFREGALMIFQYTNPRGIGVMTAADAQRIARERVEEMAETDTDRDVWIQVRKGMEDL